MNELPAHRPTPRPRTAAHLLVALLAFVLTWSGLGLAPAAPQPHGSGAAVDIAMGSGAPHGVQSREAELRFRAEYRRLSATLSGAPDPDPARDAISDGALAPAASPVVHPPVHAGLHAPAVSDAFRARAPPHRAA